MTKPLCVDVQHLTFRYNNQQHCVVDIPEFSLKQGEHVFLSGPSGCGKSTLLNLLVGLGSTYKGNIEILGQALHTLSPRQRDKFRARHIGVVFQQLNLIDYLSVSDNLQLAASFAGNKGAELDQRCQALMTQLNLTPSLLDMQASLLSVGQRQRVAIARALINQPPLLVCDEPTSALDEANTHRFMQLLMAQARQNNASLLFVSHDQRLASYFDRALNLPDINRVHTKEVE